MVDRIIRAVESAREKPTRLEQTAELYAGWFLPVVATAAIGTFAVWSYLGDVSIALFNALSVLVVACPCAFGFRSAGCRVVRRDANRSPRSGHTPQRCRRTAGPS